MMNTKNTTSTSGFWSGSDTSSNPFGASAPTPAPLGSIGEFGTTSTTIGSKAAGGQAATSGSGLFGNAPAPAPFGSTGGLGTTNTTFGSPTAAGQAATSGLCSKTSSNLVGASAASFGNAPAPGPASAPIGSTGRFGATNTTLWSPTAAGQADTGDFGSKTSSNLFGAASGFGNAPAPAPAPAPASVGSTGGFGTTNTTFGSPAATGQAQLGGTKATPLQVTNIQDGINTIMQSITAIHEVVTAAGEALEASGAFSKKESSRTPEKNEQLEGDTMMLYGGDGGESYDDGINDTRRIQSITVRAGKVVDGITVCYQSYPGNLRWEVSHGGQGGEPCTMNLLQGEYINKIILRAGRIVQSITFETNLGRRLGPCGSGKDDSMKNILKNIGYKSETYRVTAPMGCMLSGFKSRSGRVLDSIGFYFSPLLSAPEVEVLHRDGRGQ